MVEEILKIEGMSCGHCVDRVEKLIAQVDGITSFKVSLPDDVKIVFDESKTSIEEFKKKINESEIYKTL